jgi:hypothetical protein
MIVQAHNSELFQRPRARYIVFSTIFIFVVLLALVTKNFFWALLMFFLLGWYIFFNLTSTQVTNLEIKEEWLNIWNKLYPRWQMSGFSLEIDNETHQIKNIIFSSNNSIFIHTFADSIENTKRFIVELSTLIPMLSEIQLTSKEKIVRRMML